MGSEIVPSVSIDALIMKRDAMVERVTEAHRLLNEADSLAENLFGEEYRGHRLSLQNYSTRSEFTTARGLEEMIKEIDGRGWSYLLRESGLQSRRAAGGASGVIAYVGQTRSEKLIARLAALGIGECTQRGELPPRRRPWFHDNAAYSDFVAGKPFNVTRWWGDVRRIAYDKLEPDFIVLPDIVMGGVRSLQHSLDWAEVVPPELAPHCYLVVQNGMEPDDVDAVLRRARVNDHLIAGLFVGGDLDWKLETAAAWCELAHARGRRCHIGRVGPAPRVRWARSIGADSIDSSLPLRHEEHMEAFLKAVLFED